MKKGPCKICNRVTDLTKHHLIPQRIKETIHLIYVCEDCHRRLHPENDLILAAKRLQDYHTLMKKFLKTEFPAAWEAWQPIRADFKKKMKGVEKPDTVITEDM